MNNQYQIVNRNIVVKAQAKFSVLFLETENTKSNVDKIEVSCSCMKAKINPNNSISVMFNLPKFPIHFSKDKKSYQSTGKRLIIRFKDGTQEVHPITYKVFR